MSDVSRVFEERWNTDDARCVIGREASMESGIDDNVVKRAQMSYRSPATFYQGNMWLSLGALVPDGEFLLVAVRAAARRHVVAAAGCQDLVSGCVA